MCPKNEKTGYRRNYYIFSSEDSGYDSGKKASGHVRMEVRDGKGMLHAVADGLKPGNGEFAYALYILGGSGTFNGKLRAGTLEMKGSRAEIEWRFDPADVGGSGHAIEEFYIYAVIVEYPDDGHSGQNRPILRNGEIICPIAAYAGKCVEWKNRFFAFEETHVERGFRPGTSSHDNTDISARVRSRAEPGAVNNADKRSNQCTGASTDNRPMPDTGANPGMCANTADRAEANARANTSGRADADVRANTDNHADAGCPLEKSDRRIGENADIFRANELKTDKSGKFRPDDTTCGTAADDGAIPAHCRNCVLRHGKMNAQAYLARSYESMRLLAEELDGIFERSDPFASGRSDYIWWKATDPVKLNNMLYKNGVRAPLMLNPAVMTAYYRYRHLILGIYAHRTGQHYIVCGVPGMHMAEGKPFGELGKWVQAEGNRPGYGSFGYWLIYINLQDGNILQF